MLGMPTGNGTFYLDTDASDTGLGAVLSEDQNGTEVVVAYASRTLTKPEVNYDVTRRELLAVIFWFQNVSAVLIRKTDFISRIRSTLPKCRIHPQQLRLC